MRSINLNIPSYSLLNNFPNTRFSTTSLLLLVFLIIGVTQPAYSAEKGLDVALVLDTSGSMKKNDPNHLRIQAAKLFVSLLSRKDKVSLIGFSNRAYPLTPLLSLNSRKNEKKLLGAIEKMSTNGQLTNLHDALLGGYDLLKRHKEKNRSRHIILMSDGKMDLGNKERNLKLLEKTLEELTPKLAKENIKVHTIAFTSDSYIPLLKLAAEDTNGQFILLKDANGIHQVFENIFERTKLPEMLPLENDSFIVDDEVKEVTIVTSKFKPNSIITLQSPDGEEISLDNRKQNVNWFQARKFDLITVKNPARGYWKINYSEGGNKAYIVSDIKLETSSTKLNAEPGSPLHIQAKLVKNNKIIKNREILNSTKFTVKVTSPVGSMIENKLKDDGSEIGSERKDGIYGISYSFDKQGPYKIEIIAQGETFDRKKTLFVDVKSETFTTPFTIQQDTVRKPDILDTVTAENQTDNVVDNEASSQKNSQKQGEHDASSSDSSVHNKSNVDASNGPENDNRNETKIETSSHDSESDEHTSIDNHLSASSEKELTADELEASSHFGVKDAVIAFISFNAFLAMMGGGYYFWYRRQQKQKDKDKSPTEENETSDTDSKADPFTDININDTEPESSMELSSQDEFSTSISDIDLEDELSSILENEKDDK
ncbi:MAG: VWA domain-containing protein [Gammaproteobacteria bacterium]|nr:VWA domain-containing protein [Gammaproteobacteria bacterium]